jgi:hypothetical protein
MIDNISKYLPNEIIEYYCFMHSLKTSKDEWKYRFMPDGEYKKIDDLNRQAKIYWSEMLYRTHIVVLVSMFKALRWIDSLDNNTDNYYGFCSSLRCLIESCADSFYTLRFAPLTIAKDYRAIYESIKNNSSIILTHGPLEAILIHFIQGTKLSKEQKKTFPEEYNAKQTVEYLSSIEGGNEKIKQLYNLLCGVSHPAYESTRLFLFESNDETIVCSDSCNGYEIQLIESLMKNFGESLLKMFRVFMTNVLSTLNLLNYFQMPEIHTKIETYIIEGHESWGDIAMYMQESQKRYMSALKKGVYE